MLMNKEIMSVFAQKNLRVKTKSISIIGDCDVVISLILT